MFVIPLPTEVGKIIKILEDGGYEAYIVGGCVRDEVMNLLFGSNISPKDWDITTSASPEQTIECLSLAGIKTIPTGIKHGTVSAIIENQNYEITTYRIEGKYLNHRSPSEVKFTTELQDDLSRRDFTINAMAYHPIVGLVDIYGGVQDLMNKSICAVGDPFLRFEEDALRILRALRFASRLSFAISETTSEAIFAHMELLKFISIERIMGEMGQILCGENAPKVLDKYYKVILFALMGEDMPKDDNHSHYKIVATMLGFCPSNPTVRLIVLLYFGIKNHQEIAKILKRVKIAKWTEKMILNMGEYLDNALVDEKIWIKEQLGIMGEKNFRVFLDIKKAFFMAYSKEEELSKLKAITYQFEKIIEDKEPIAIADLAINGDDLQMLGIPKGKKIKEILHQILKAVMSEKIPNDKNSLKDFAFKIINP